MQTISFITKKATAIYRLKSSLFLLLLPLTSFAQEDLASFCFEKGTPLEAAKNSLEFLLLPKEKVFMRPADNCFDVTTSTNRVKLLEKFLSKRYTLIRDEKEPEKILESCEIELLTKKMKNTDSKNLRLGSQNSIGVGQSSREEVSTAKILLGIGKPGTLEMEGRSLYMECKKGARETFNLTFSYSEIYRAKVSSEVTVKAGEPVQIAQITNDLKEKSKTLGLPETLYQDVQGKENVSYELSVR